METKDREHDSGSQFVTTSPLLSARLLLMSVMLAFAPSAGMAAGQGGENGTSAVFRFQSDDVRIHQQHGFDVITYRRAEPNISLDRPGHPQLPVFVHHFILPPETYIRDLTITVVEADTIEGEFLPYPIQSGDDGEFVPPDSLIYESWIPYPERPIQLNADGHLRGYHLATIVVYPLQYIGGPRELVLLKEIRVDGDIVPLPPERLSRLHRRYRPDLRPLDSRGEVRWIKGTVYNPGDFDAYYRGDVIDQQAVAEENPFGGFVPTEFPSLEGPPVEYVIVTSNEKLNGEDVSGDMVSVFQDLADWKTLKGAPAVVKTVEWITEHYGGHDRAEAIRNFARDAASYWGTNYLLLGGDVDIVPTRFLGGPDSDTTEGTINRTDPPADMYLAEFDKSWNYDQDAYFAEICFDLGGKLGVCREYWDLWLGRIPAYDSTSARTMVDKVMAYERCPGTQVSIDPDYYERVLLVAGLTENPDTTDFLNGIYTSETIGDTLALSSYSTEISRIYSNIPDTSYPCNGGASVACYQQMNALLSGYSASEIDDFTYQNFRAKLNEGQHFVWHVEHSHRRGLGDTSFGDAVEPVDCSNDNDWTTSCFNDFKGLNSSSGTLTAEMVDDLSNGDNLSIVLSAGSWTNKWDADAISEHFLRAPFGGAVGYFGKSSSRGGTSFNPPRAFFRNIYSLEIEHLGEATGLATNSSQSQQVEIAVVWNLLGDPELPLWTAAPDSLKLVITPSTLSGFGPQTITVEVQDFGSETGIDGARVALKQTDLAYAVAWTNDEGEAVFSAFAPLSDDSIAVVATARNYRPKQTNIKFQDLAGADYMAYQSHERDDDVTGGDGDDVLEAGESIDLDIAIKNLGTGVSPVTGLNARLWPTAPVTFNLDIEGVYDPARIFIGEKNATPVDSFQTTLSDSFRIPAAWQAIRPEGQPTTTEMKTAILVWRDTTAVWHVRARYGLDNDDVVTGSLRTVGGFHSVGGSYESPDEVTFNASSNPNVIDFEFHRDLSPDELTFRAESSDWIDILTDNVHLESLAGGETDTALFSVTWAPEIPDNDDVIFTLAVRDTSDNWSYSDFSETVHAPVVRQLAQATRTVSGSYDTLYVTPTLTNLGSTTADDITLVYHIKDGPETAAVLDSVVVFLSIAPGDTLRDRESFVVESQSGFSGLEYDLEIRTYHPDGDSSVHIVPLLDIDAPAAPTNVLTDEGDGFVVLRWTPSASSDLEGYHVFKDLQNETTRLTREPIRGVARYEIHGLETFDSGEYIDYRYTVTAVDSSGNESGKARSDTAHVSLPEHPGWPRRIRSGSGVAVKAADVDGDGDLEIFAAGREIYAWHDDGTPLIDDNPDGLFYDPEQGDDDSVHVFVEALAIGDIDGDGRYEIVGNVFEDGIYVVEYNSTSESVNEEWYAEITSRASPPILADLDGTDGGKLEVIISNDDDGSIHVWNDDGSDYPSGTSQLTSIPYDPPFQYRRLAVADVHSADGHEILQAITDDILGDVGNAKGDTVYCWNGITGEQLWAAFVPIDFQLSGPWPNLSSPAIGDVDGETGPEVVVVSAVREKEDEDLVYTRSGVYVLEGQSGSLIDSLATDTFRFRGTAVNMPILADLDEDAALEILIGGGKWGRDSEAPWPNELLVHVINWNGSALVETTAQDNLPIPGRKVTKTGSLWSPVVANIDSDDHPEIINSTTDSYLAAWDWDAGSTAATAERGWPQLLPDDGSTPLIADIDASGDLEIVLEDRSGLVHVFDLTGDTVDPRLEWAEYAHDAFNTSSYDTDVSSLANPKPSFGLASKRTGITSVSPNPFNPIGRIAFELAAPGHVTLRVYDVKGRLVKELANENMDAGSHELAWDGRCQEGSLVASGIYFYKLTTGSSHFLRKVLLLK